MGDRLCIEFGKQLLQSKAWFKLSKSAKEIYGIFLCKRRGKWINHDNKRKENEWLWTNLKQLEFTYLEALNKYNFSKSTFQRGLKELFEYGFLDIIKSGGQLWHQKALYGISDRWREYDTEKFVPYKRIKKPVIGWMKK